MLLILEPQCVDSFDSRRLEFFPLPMRLLYFGSLGDTEQNIAANSNTTNVTSDHHTL